MLICIPCRDANPVVNEEFIHNCGERLTASPRNWAPPKKNDKRAWKRIAQGEWLWDRRRVRRNPPKAIYDRRSWVKMPGHKPGQPRIFQDNVPRASGPEVDLGG